MNQGYFCVGGFVCDLLEGWIVWVEVFLNQMECGVEEYIIFFVVNLIFLDWVKGVGVIFVDVVFDFGLIGLNLWVLGVLFDNCKDYFYCGFEDYDFNVIFSFDGDLFVCFNMWLFEFSESIKIICQGL